MFRVCDSKLLSGLQLQVVAEGFWCPLESLKYRV